MKATASIMSDKFFKEYFDKVSNTQTLKESIPKYFGERYKGYAHIDNKPSLIDSLVKTVVLDEVMCEKLIVSHYGDEYLFFTMVRMYQAFLYDFGRYPVIADEIKEWKTII